MENSDKQWISETTRVDRRWVDRRLAVSEQAVYTSYTLLTSKTRSGSSLRGVDNRVIITAEARRVFKEWGMQMRVHLDRIHQKE